MVEQEQKKLIEAAIFMTGGAVSLERMKNLLKTESNSLVLDIIEELQKEYEARDTALEVVKTSEGTYTMQVKNKYLPKVKDLAMSVDFNRAVLRTLAIVAYKQPIKQSIVVKMRGNKAYDHVKELHEQGFIVKEREGRTYSLTTTKKFEEYFGATWADVQRRKEGEAKAEEEAQENNQSNI